LVFVGCLFSVSLALVFVLLLSLFVLPSLVFVGYLFSVLLLGFFVFVPLDLIFVPLDLIFVDYLVFVLLALVFVDYLVFVLLALFSSLWDSLISRLSLDLILH